MENGSINQHKDLHKCGVKFGKKLFGHLTLLHRTVYFLGESKRFSQKSCNFAVVQIKNR